MSPEVELGGWTELAEGRPREFRARVVRRRIG
jgi:hypothetical protein